MKGRALRGSERRAHRRTLCPASSKRLRGDTALNVPEVRRGRAACDEVQVREAVCRLERVRERRAVKLHIIEGTCEFVLCRHDRAAGMDLGNVVDRPEDAGVERAPDQLAFLEE